MAPLYLLHNTWCPCNVWLAIFPLRTRLCKCGTVSVLFPEACLCLYDARHRMDADSRAVTKGLRELSRKDFTVLSTAKGWLLLPGQWRGVSVSLRTSGLLLYPWLCAWGAHTVLQQTSWSGECGLSSWSLSAAPRSGGSFAQCSGQI